MGRRGGRFRAIVLIAAGSGVAVATTLTLLRPPDERPALDALGFRAGGGLFDGAEFEATEAWLDREIAYTVQFTGRQSQQDMNGSAFGLLVSDDSDIADFADRMDLSLTIPLGFGTADARTREGRDEIKANLEAVVAGEFDDAYQRVAVRLLEAGFDDAILRLGHEFNGAWAPWSSQTNEEEFINAWRHVHDIMTAESPAFRFDWTAVRPAWFEWGPMAYPGDEYVDIIGLDVYWRTDEGPDQWDPEVWRRQFERVMLDHHTFAVARDKPVSYPEWAIGGADVPQFIDAMHQWLSELPTEGPGRLEYHAYFDGNREFDLDLYPAARRRYRELFGD